MKQWNAPEIQVLNVSNTLNGWKGSISEELQGAGGKNKDYYDPTNPNIGNNPNAS